MLKSPPIDTQTHPMALPSKNFIDDSWTEISLATDNIRNKEDGLSSSGLFRRKVSTPESALLANEAKSNRAYSGNSTAEKDKIHQISKDAESTTKRSIGSLASQYGLMLMSNASQVVGLVTSGGKRKEVTIQRLQNDLDGATEKCALLENELQKAMQWIYYYENIKGDLESQLKEEKTEFESQLKKVKERVKMFESEKELFEKEVEKAKVKAEETASAAKNKMRKAELIIAEKQKQKENVKDGTTETLDNNELTETKKALQLAFQRNKKLNKQLSTALSSLRSQSTDMNSYRSMLEITMNKAKTTKALLKDEKKKCFDLENLLKEKKKSLESLEEKLEEKESSLQKEIENRNKLQLQHELKNQIISRNEQNISEVELHKVAGVLTSSMLNEAMQEELVHMHEVEILEIKAEVNEKQERVEELEESNNQMNHQIKVLEGRLELLMHHQDKRDKERIQAESNLVQIKTELNEKEKSENNLKKLVSESSMKLSKVELHYKSVVKNQQDEMAKLHSNVQSLKDQIENHSKYDSSSQRSQLSIGTQTETEEYAARNPFYLKRTESSQSLPPENQEHVNSKWKKLHEDISFLQTENKRLKDIIEEDRKVIYYKNMDISRANYDRECFEWERKRFEESMWHMQNEIKDLHHSIRSRSFHDGQRSTHRQQNLSSKQLYREENRGKKHAPRIKLETITEKDEQACSPVSSSFDYASSTSSVDVKRPFGSNDRAKSACSTNVERENAKPTSTKELNCPEVSVCSKNAKSVENVHSFPFSSYNHTRHNTVSDVASNASSDGVFSMNKTPSLSPKTLQLPLHMNHHGGVLQRWLDDGYSSYCNSSEESPNTGRTLVSEKRDVDLKRSGDAPTHYYASYNGVTFDLATLTVPGVRNIVSKCGAITSTQGMNDFYDFLAGKVQELNQDPNWIGKHNLGSAENWLCLKNPV